MLSRSAVVLVNNVRFPLKRPLSSAVLRDGCSECEDAQSSRIGESSQVSLKTEGVKVHVYKATSEEHKATEEGLPPPLPPPKYSVQKRVLPSNLTALSSLEGRKMLMECVGAGTAESYWAISEHFQNQSEPAYCGVTVLVVVLNSMGVDPQVRWRGGWRYYGTEDVLLDRCCWDKRVIERIGISMEGFAKLGACQGLESVRTKRPDAHSVDDFRRDVKDVVVQSGRAVVVSFSRAALGQTGGGHYSPIAAYHEESDKVLVMDVARFKYPPYWVALEELYEATVPVDSESGKSRGWILMEPPRPSKYYTGLLATEEMRLPAHMVPEVGQPELCPLGKIKREYCSGSRP